MLEIFNTYFKDIYYVTIFVLTLNETFIELRCFFFFIQNYLQVVFEALCIRINCLHPNKLDMVILCFYYSLSYIYHLRLHIDVCYFCFFLNVLAMLILVLIKNVILYHFEYTNHDNHIDFLIQNPSKLFSHIWNQHL